MGRRKTLTDDVLSIYYHQIISTLKASEDKYMYIDDLAKVTGLKKHQITKAVQWGRRNFNHRKMSVKSYVMSSPYGYFLPNTGQEVIAYVVQFQRRIECETRTQRTILNYAQEVWPIQLDKAYKSKPNDEDIIDDESRPWEVFDDVVNKDLGEECRKEIEDTITISKEDN